MSVQTRHPSYAFDGEDNILWDLIGTEKTEGFFIDVGANDPEYGCVSKSFYEAGWRGINVEPLRYQWEKFFTSQPESVNLCVALGDAEGKAILRSNVQCDHWATLNGRQPFPFAPEELYIEVDVVTLATVCELWVRGPIDWLKVDVEGWEDKVLRSGDWEHFRPAFLCIESIVPHTRDHSHGAWEPFILDQGYEFVHEYQLNRFYQRVGQ